MIWRVVGRQSEMVCSVFNSSLRSSHSSIVPINKYTCSVSARSVRKVCNKESLLGSWISLGCFVKSVCMASGATLVRRRTCDSAERRKCWQHSRPELRFRRSSGSLRASYGCRNTRSRLQRLRGKAQSFHIREYQEPMSSGRDLVSIFVISGCPKIICKCRLF